MKTVYKYKNLIEITKFDIKKKKIKNFHKIKLSDACSCIINYKNKILITKEYRVAFKKKVYGLPGGMIDENETPLQCLKGEIKEELGVNLKNIKKLISFKGNGNYECGNFNIFKATIDIDRIVIEKGIAYKWVSIKELKIMIKNKEFKTPGLISALFYYLNDIGEVKI